MAIKLKRFSTEKLTRKERVLKEFEYLKDKPVFKVVIAEYSKMKSGSSAGRKVLKDGLTVKEATNLIKSHAKDNNRELKQGFDDYNARPEYSFEGYKEYLSYGYGGVFLGKSSYRGTIGNYTIYRMEKLASPLIKEAREKGILPKP